MQGFDCWSCSLPGGGCSKLGLRTCLEVPIIRIIEIWGQYWGHSYFGKLPGLYSVTYLLSGGCMVSHEADSIASFLDLWRAVVRHVFV